ncbi:hypothetical protein SAMN04490248_10531 [Salinihabitans flavidus]|uniref:Uncharacterized protein n=1 Tax=Salinihabitans flavidus TaxID=569882 RepID=A0A1H8PKN1_9RHOB|nr:hypothetical protein [Salinihabitans flavidus]SEO42093.1 hypothetical protein SAMN04490248_10531 [Salinihabitans flavidus]
MPDRAPVLLADSVTKLGPEAAGRVVVSGSHGGRYAAYLAFRAGCRAVILNDAGIGLDAAGIGGLEWLEAQGMAAASVDHRSADIGDARAMLERGWISYVNAGAARLGVRPGMACAEAVGRLEQANPPGGACDKVTEARQVLTPAGATCRLVLVDSAGLVQPEDAGQVVVTGSHGAVFGGDPANALKVAARLALFNDAGGGVGQGRLPVLESRGIAAATVAAHSARIGDARSTWEDGVISACNSRAEAFGARAGMAARDLVQAALEAENTDSADKAPRQGRI